MRLGDRLFTAVYDASESHGDLSSDQLVSAALDAVIESGQGTALIAVNDGRLLQFFDDHGGEYENWGFDVKDQVNGKETPGSRLALVDLKRRSLASEDGHDGPALKPSRAWSTTLLGGLQRLRGPARLPDSGQPQHAERPGRCRSSTSSCASATCGAAAEPPSETSARQSPG